MSRNDLPPLMQDRSFWAMVVTQFLGAFNDNLFKQLMLLLAVPVAVAGAQAKGEDAQGIASILFALPFVLFSGFAGYLADRGSKRGIIVMVKVAEICVMLLGLIGFAMYGVTGYDGLLVVLFLMGLQSTFFGPAKYGILPELFREEDLARANGIIIMSTFLAIIFGTVSAGGLGDLLVDRAQPETASRLWMGSLVCVGIAVVGTLSSLLIRYVPPAIPDLKFSWEVVFNTVAMKHAERDRPLMWAVLASCMFWLVSGFAIPAINSLGLRQLGLSDTKTSVLTAVIGLGIALGAVAAGKLSTSSVDFRLMRIGSWGIVLLCIPMAITIPNRGHLLGFTGSLVVLTCLGASAGLFAIPVQVFIQARPPAGLKGRILALMNQANFLAIAISGFIYELFDGVIDVFNWPRSATFALMSLFMLPVALFYRPRPAEDAEDAES